MLFDFRRLLLWPLAFAILFAVIPPFLFHLYPISFWSGGDYEALGLGNALNLAYRLGDFRLYSAVGLGDHPGVPFYFMSWLALAFTGYPFAFKGPGFFNAVIGHIEDYHRASIWLAALVGGSGIYVFARAAQRLVPISVVAIALLAWLASTPATLLMFMTPSIESFGLLINSLFFWALVRLADDRNFAPTVTVLMASVSAFAYLNKLSYINVSLALGVTGLLSLFVRSASLSLARRRTALFVLTSLLVIFVVGIFIIGWNEFLHVLRFHKNIVFNSGLYGQGDQFVVSANDIRDAIAAIPRDKAFALPIALVAGGALLVGGLFAARRGPEQIPVAVICIGAGLASVFSAVFVLKHYDLHYTAGVSPTLPAAVVAIYLLVKSWGHRLRMVEACIAAVAVGFLAWQTLPPVIANLQARTHRSELAEADLREITVQRGSDQRAVAFLYKTPFSLYGEGFAVSNASVPRLTDDYIGSRREMFSASAAGLAGRQVGAYVIDKNYFPTAESIKASSNLTLLEPTPVTFENGDRLVELRTAFLLIRQ